METSPSSDAEVAGLLNRGGRGGLGLDDVEMDAAASRAAHGPVFGVAAGNDAQDDE